MLYMYSHIRNSSCLFHIKWTKLIPSSSEGRDSLLCLVECNVFLNGEPSICYNKVPWLQVVLPPHALEVKQIDPWGVIAMSTLVVMCCL